MAHNHKKTVQAAVAKEKQDAKVIYIILDNSKTVQSLVNEQVHQEKSEHEKILPLPRAYSANTITTGKNLPTSFSSITVSVTSPTTTGLTTVAHSLPSSSLSSTITVTSTITTESTTSSLVTIDEVIVSVYQHVYQGK